MDTWSCEKEELTCIKFYSNGNTPILKNATQPELHEEKRQNENLYKGIGSKSCFVRGKS